MKSYGCKFCCDLRNIQPAKYLGVSNITDEKLKEKIRAAQRNKYFLLFEGDFLYVVDRCPKCGHIFSVEDYDSYD